MGDRAMAKSRKHTVNVSELAFQRKKWLSAITKVSTSETRVFPNKGKIYSLSRMK